MAHFICNFKSYYLSRDISIDVIVPEPVNIVTNGNHKVEHPFPLLLFLHGGANDTDTIHQYTSIERYAEKENIIVVTISGENKYSRNLFCTYVSTDSKRVVIAEDFSSFITKELPNFISSYFPVSEKTEDHYICGLSAGGYGALYNALSLPNNYHAVGLFSPLVMPRTYLMSLSDDQRKNMMNEPESKLKSLFLPELLSKIQQCKIQGHIPPPFFIESGSYEYDMIPFHKILKEELSCIGTSVETRFDRPYGHEWSLWDKCIQDFLKWIPRNDFYVSEKRSNTNG